jgi:hypothetical protein
MLIPFGVLSAAAGGAPAGAGDYELIATEILTASQASITFSSLGDYSSTYKHFQIRGTVRDNLAGGPNNFQIRFNGNTGSNYANHGLFANGSSVFGSSLTSTSATSAFGAVNPSANADASIFGAFVMDILDPYSTSKNLTIRTLAGHNQQSANRLSFASGLFNDTASITSIELFPTASAIFVSGSRFSIYGVRG